jgi:DNA-binding transcriptional LysR family regulator
MARDGRGVAWSPLSLVGEDLTAGRLVRAGTEEWDVRVQIRLIRPHARQSPSAERFWALGGKASIKARSFEKFTIFGAAG